MVTKLDKTTTYRAEVMNQNQTPPSPHAYLAFAGITLFLSAISAIAVLSIEGAKPIFVLPIIAGAVVSIKILMDIRWLITQVLNSDIHHHGVQTNAKTDEEQKKKFRNGIKLFVILIFVGAFAAMVLSQQEPAPVLEFVYPL
jgi:hypothetical protein